MRPCAIVLAVTGLFACRDSSGSDRAFVRSNLLSAPPPSIGNPSGARFAAGIVYLGCDVDTQAAVAGGSFSVTHFFQVEKTVGPEWKIFTHVVGDGDEFANADGSPMRERFPVGKWRAGQIIRDKQVIEIDAGWSAKSASVRLGFFRGSGERMAVSGGDVDSEGRLVAAEVAVKRREATYTIARAKEPIVIDGRADESDWQRATWSPWFQTAAGGRDPVGRARARLLWDDANLYAHIEVEDSDIYSPFGERDDTLWKADVVELFIDADKNGRGYVELQVNPRNAVFDAYFPVTRAQPHHFEWNSSLSSAVVVSGTPDRSGDADVGWATEIAIPHADVLGLATIAQQGVPPKPGDSWRLNVVRVDTNHKAKSITASSWNPITIRDFHALGRMLTVVFGE